MSDTTITIPAEFANATIQREGEAGRRWIESLPDLVASCLDRWSLVRDGSPMHGYVGLVLPVLRGRERCVLKLSWLDESNADEARALAAWNGDGAVRLLKSDAPEGALLLERLDPHRSLVSAPVGEAGDVAGRLLRRLCIPNDDERIRDLEHFAAELRETLPRQWRRTGAAVPRAFVDEALLSLDELVPTASRLLVDSDLHYENVLAGTREPWLVIDPKVVIGDPEFGVAPLLWNRLDEIVAAGGVARQLDIIVRAAQLDTQRARAWARIRTIEYWLWSLDVGLTEDPLRCAAIHAALR